MKDNVSWGMRDGPALCITGDWEAEQELCLAGLTQPGDVLYEADSASMTASFLCAMQQPSASAAGHQSQKQHEKQSLNP